MTLAEYCRVAAGPLLGLALLIGQVPPNPASAEPAPITPTIHQPIMATTPPGPDVQVETIVGEIVESTPKPYVTHHIPLSYAQSAPIASSKHDWLTAAGVPEGVWGCADTLINRESGWRVNALNPSSGAYGIPQALPGTKMASAGADYLTNPITQLRWMDGYVKARYGGFCQALDHSNARGWY